jgi:hypothetical protein
MAIKRLYSGVCRRIQSPGKVTPHRGRAAQPLAPTPVPRNRIIIQKRYCTKDVVRTFAFGNFSLVIIAVQDRFLVACVVSFAIRLLYSSGHRQWICVLSSSSCLTSRGRLAIQLGPLVIEVCQSSTFRAVGANIATDANFSLRPRYCSPHF